MYRTRTPVTNAYTAGDRLHGPWRHLDRVRAVEAGQKHGRGHVSTRYADQERLQGACSKRWPQTGSVIIIQDSQHGAALGMVLLMAAEIERELISQRT